MKFEDKTISWWKTNKKVWTKNSQWRQKSTKTTCTFLPSSFGYSSHKPVIIASSPPNVLKISRIKKEMGSALKIGVSWVYTVQHALVSNQNNHLSGNQGVVTPRNPAILLDRDDILIRSYSVRRAGLSTVQISVLLGYFCLAHARNGKFHRHL